MEEQFLNEILKDTFTLENLRKRAMALKLRVERKIFQSSDDKVGENESLNETGKSSLDQARKWAREFDKKILDEVTADNFREVFERIDLVISEAKSLTIYFVFIPDEGQIKQIGEWLRKSLNNPKLIFDVKVDPNLIGGCAIVYKGVYKDYSLKAKISQNKGKLMEEFRRYLRN